MRKHAIFHLAMLVVTIVALAQLLSGCMPAVQHSYSNYQHATTTTAPGVHVEICPPYCGPDHK